MTVGKYHHGMIIIQIHPAPTLPGLHSEISQNQDGLELTIAVTTKKLKRKMTASLCYIIFKICLKNFITTIKIKNKVRAKQ